MENTLNYNEYFEAEINNMVDFDDLLELEATTGIRYNY